MEKKEFIANNENLSFTDEELKKIDGAKEFVIEQGKKCLERYFDLDEMNKINCLKNKSFELKVFWAMERDLKMCIDEKNEQLHVLWRVVKNQYTPQLMSIRENKNSIVFKTKEYNDDKTWHDRTIKYPKDKYLETLKTYEETIAKLKEKYGIIEC